MSIQNIVFRKSELFFMFLVGCFCIVWATEWIYPGPPKNLPETALAGGQVAPKLLLYTWQVFSFREGYTRYSTPIGVALVKLAEWLLDFLATRGAVVAKCRPKQLFVGGDRWSMETNFRSKCIIQGAGLLNSPTQTL
ncbi:hypothetical protein C8J57DRAFT_1236036 [Mycena rebaudengoi]|nr:hypothetical protein C8J57DRAFT_1236036 [Mycena rebaudengoi]